MGELKILSQSGEPFRDRTEAGRLLAEPLADCRGPETVVLGIPRGGVVVADALARELGAEMDVVLSRKVPAPVNPEFAIGAVAESGDLFLTPRGRSVPGVSDDYVEEQRQRQVELLRQRAERYRKVKPRAQLEGRTVIITDDGVATGATMQVALWAARKEAPERLIAAVPVGSRDRLTGLAEDADLLIALRVPPTFAAVGQFYREFDQTPDETVVELLARYGDKGDSQ